jgi:glucose/mannose transport system substrate-binding protein
MKKLAFLISAATLVAAAPVLAQDLTAEVFTSWTSAGEAAAVRVIADAFDAKGGKWVDASIAGFENANAAFQARMTANDPPTAVHRIVGAQSAEFVDAGMLSDISASANADWLAALTPSLADSVTYDGKVYLAPIGLHGQSWMFFNKKVFADAGVTTPFANWDEFFAGMDKLKAAGVTPIAWGGQTWQEAIVFHAVLLSVVGVDGYHKIMMEHSGAAAREGGMLKAFQVFGKMRDYVDEGAPGRNWNDATAMLINGTGGVQFMGDWAKGEFVAAGKGIGDEFGCEITPGSEGMAFIADSFAFPVLGDKLSDAQSLLLDTIMSKDVQVGFSVLKGSIPARTDVDLSKLDSCAQTGVSMMSAGKAVPEPAIFLPPSELGELKDLVGLFWSDATMTPEAAAESYAAILDKI